MRFISRVGGMAAAPRSTLAAAHQGQAGNGLRDLLLLMVLVLLATHLQALVRTVWFFIEVSFSGGLSLLINLLSELVVVQLMAALVGSLALNWFAGRAGQGQGRARGHNLDLASVCVLPLLWLQGLAGLVLVLGGWQAPAWLGHAVLGAGGAWSLALLLLAAGVVRRDSGAHQTQEPRNPRSRISTWVGVAVMGLLGLLLCLNTLHIVRHPDTVRPVRKGSPAPAFDLPTLAGERVSLSGLRGRVVLISFWASWCKPCLREMPFLARLQSTLQRQGLSVLAINVEGEEEPALRLLKHKDWPRVLIDDGQVAARYGVQTLPHLTLVDRQGKVSYTQVGGGKEQALEQRVREALDAK